VTVDNGTADGETQPHARRLLSEECIKDTILILLGDAGSGVAYGQHDRRSVLNFSRKAQLPIIAGRGAQSIDRVPDQVQNHLLQLDRVGLHDRLIGAEIGRYGNPACEQVGLGQGDRVPDKVVDVHGVAIARLGLEQRAYARDDLVYPPRVRLDVPENDPDLRKFRWRRTKLAERNVCIERDCAEWVSHLVGDR